MGCMYLPNYNYDIYLLENGDSHEMWIMSVDCGEPKNCLLHIYCIYIYRCIDYQFQTILYRSVGMISYGLRLSLRMLNVNIYIYTIIQLKTQGVAYPGSSAVILYTYSFI